MEENRIRDRPAETAAVKWHPMLFSATMIRAIREDRKTVTRRIIKPQPTACPHPHCSEMAGLCKELVSPYRVGDFLWTRETWRTAKSLNDKSPTAIGAACLDAGWNKPWAPIQYLADGATDNADTLSDFGGEWGKTRVAIHMPRWASRDSLEVLLVRAERLQDITDEDAIREGIEAHDCDGVTYYGPLNHGHCCPRQGFQMLWDSINGDRAPWSSNPWVWRVEFRSVT